jgi:FMN-dependent NADH-azoreductase
LLVDELMAADTVVIAAAMINFTIPSTLKSWIDYIARPCRTFSYSESGPKGLVTGKRVFLVVARGGVYSDKKQFDFQLPYLLHVLAFVGMTDVEVIDIEGTAFGPEAAERAVAAVRVAVGTIALERRAALRVAVTKPSSIWGSGSPARSRKVTSVSGSDSSSFIRSSAATWLE